MTEHYEHTQSHDDKDSNNNDGEELVIDDRIGERRRAEQ
jgi:hypothetical protein